MSPGFRCAEEYLQAGDYSLPCYPFFVGWMRAKGFVLDSGQGEQWIQFQDYLLEYAKDI